MPTNPDRALERLLKAELRGRATGTPATPSCVDAETFAAWADGTLPAAEAARVEAHLADCAPCQSLLAAFARTEAVPAASVVPFRPRLSPRWLVPLAAGTLAATLLLWTMWPSKPPAPAPAQTIAEVQPPPATPVPPPAATFEERKELKDAAKTKQDAAKRQEPGPRANSDRKTEAFGQRGQGSVDALDKLAKSRAQTAAVPPPPSPVAQPTTAQSTIGGLPPSTAPRPAPPARADAVPPTLNERVEAVERIVLEFSSLDLQVAQPETITLNGVNAAGGAARGGGGGGGGGRGGGRGGGGGTAGGAAAGAGATAPVFRAATPAPPLRWRVMSTGNVQRSADSGTTWEPVTIDPPAPITSGVAPSPLLCWLIGRTGVVLLSTDGLHFTRVTPPAPVALTSITATGPRDATVTTVDGRTFVTTDGGQSWTQRIT